MLLHLAGDIQLSTFKHHSHMLLISIKTFSDALLIIMQSKVTFMNNVLLLESHNVMQYGIHTVKLFEESERDNYDLIAIMAMVTTVPVTAQWQWS